MVVDFYVMYGTYLINCIISPAQLDLSTDYLYVRGLNYISGVFPPCLLTMPRLKRLLLTANSITGPCLGLCSRVCACFNGSPNAFLIFMCLWLYTFSLHRYPFAIPYPGEWSIRVPLVTGLSDHPWFRQCHRTDVRVAASGGAHVGGLLLVCEWIYRWGITTDMMGNGGAIVWWLLLVWKGNVELTLED